MENKNFERYFINHDLHQNQEFGFKTFEFVKCRKHMRI